VLRKLYAGLVVPLREVVRLEGTVAAPLGTFIGQLFGKLFNDFIMNSTTELVLQLFTCFVRTTVNELITTLPESCGQLCTGSS